ncbi:tyrosine-type recombinase/integrase [Sphaerisporangium corydalis]|uniref:Site-specific integrase n=1 Tax=Sphaerisporangium corydalis TaxID=1441875 RepID=A0ABV9ERQ5_9ACTN|nr:site-specific integrase [Sphaerisporangium corydalis]
MSKSAISNPEEELKNTKTRTSRKRSNGEGTIVQRKDGRYEAKVFLPTTAGTVKRISVYGRTREECHTKFIKLKAQGDRGIPVAAESWTVGDYLTYWLEHVVRAERRPKTVQGYEGVIRRYLVPALGRKRLDKLNAAEVRQFVTSLRNGCQCCQRGWDKARKPSECCAKKGGACCEHKIQARMVQSIHAVLRNALENAVREEVIHRNVAKLVKISPPKYKVNRGLTVAQAKAILNAAQAHRLGALYVLAVCLGLRRGELLGLRWKDIDLEAGSLEVIQALQRVAGQLRFVKPKSEDSERTIPLPPLCLDVLREHHKRQIAERSDRWPDWEDHGLVFPSRRGTPMEPDNLRRSWAEIRATAGLGAVRLHDLRHTCVSLLLDLGVPPHTVKEIVGHSDIEVTMTIYAHSSLSDKRAALGKLGDVLA